MTKLPQDLRDLQDIDLAELNVDSATSKLVRRLPNCIETLVGDLNEAQTEIQRLRDEIARLKGEKGKPKFKANRPPEEDDESPDDPAHSKPDQTTSAKSRPPRKPPSDTDPGPSVPRNERITVDREEVVTLDRSQLPSDVRHRGYRDVTIRHGSETWRVRLTL